MNDMESIRAKRTCVSSRLEACRASQAPEKEDGIVLASRSVAESNAVVLGRYPPGFDAQPRCRTCLDAEEARLSNTLRDWNLARLTAGIAEGGATAPEMSMQSIDGYGYLPITRGRA